MPLHPPGPSCFIIFCARSIWSSDISPLFLAKAMHSSRWELSSQYVLHAALLVQPPGPLAARRDKAVLLGKGAAFGKVLFAVAVLPARAARAAAGARLSDKLACGLYLVFAHHAARLGKTKTRLRVRAVVAVRFALGFRVASAELRDGEGYLRLAGLRKGNAGPRKEPGRRQQRYGISAHITQKG